MNVKTNVEYAMKIMNKRSIRRKTIGPGIGGIGGANGDVYDSLQQEMAIMKKLDHPYILKLYEIIDDPKDKKLYLIIELVRNGSLVKRVQPPPKSQLGFSKKGSKTPKAFEPLTEETIRKYFRQLILAVEYCHETLNIIHRDIKPENILISDDDDIKLADFGVSLLLKQDGNDLIRSNKGSVMFFSPEAVEGDSYRGKPNDIWACGITLYYMLTGNYPYTSDYQKLHNDITKREPDYP